MYSPIVSAALTLVIGLHAQIINTNPAANPTYLTTTDSEVKKEEIKKAPEPAVKHKLSVKLTAYSSSPDETDDTPNTTAMNTTTRHGVVAANMLPLGTRIKIPSIYGDEIFVVEDRMHPRMEGKVDIWMPSKQKALAFGIKNAEILVLE